MLICPNCKSELHREQQSFYCDNRHCFDIAKSGYVNLVMNHHMKQGDDKDMVKARSNFLNQGYYEELAKALISKIEPINHEVICDAGCGEGYYTHLIKSAFPESELFGFDLSKSALMHAAKQNDDIQYAISSIFDLPLSDASCDIVLNIFAPCADREFHRILKPQGKLIQVLPSPRHLYQLKELLYEKVYENEDQVPSLEGFTSEVYEVKTMMHIEHNSDIQSLFQMTPYYWKTSPCAKERIKECTHLDCEAAFYIAIHQKT